MLYYKCMKNILTKNLDPKLVSKLYIFWSLLIILTLINVTEELVNSTELFWPLDEVFIYVGYVGVIIWASMYLHVLITAPLLFKLFLTKHHVPKHVKIALVFALPVLFFAIYFPFSLNIT